MGELVMKADTQLALDHAILKVTVRLGGRLGIAVAILATMIKL